MTGILSGTSSIPQPKGGILKAEFFDPVPVSLSYGRILSKENLPGDVVSGAVKMLSCLEAMARDTGFDLDGRLLLERTERAVFETDHQHIADRESAETYARGITARVGGFDMAAADCACKLAFCLLAPEGRSVSPSRIRADDRTCNNILTMVERMTFFLDVMGPVRRICFRFNGGYGNAIDEGYGLFLTDGCLWDVTVSPDPLPDDARLRLLVRYVLSLNAVDPSLKSITNIGVMNPRLNCAYMMPVSSIPEDVLLYASEGIVGVHLH